MIKIDTLPESYVPYGVTRLCGNKVIGGSFIVAIGDALPILIGKGPKPQIWLQALESKQSKRFIPLVEASISVHPQVTVTEIRKKIEVKVDGKRVLLLGQTGMDELTIHKIDLRPIGFAIFGDFFGLNAGGMSFKRNTFSNLVTLIAIAEI